MRVVIIESSKSLLGLSPLRRFGDLIFQIKDAFLLGFGRVWVYINHPSALILALRVDTVSRLLIINTYIIVLVFTSHQKLRPIPSTINHAPVKTLFVGDCALSGLTYIKKPRLCTKSLRVMSIRGELSTMRISLGVKSEWLMVTLACSLWVI
jgi:hypothetical protein